MKIRNLKMTEKRKAYKKAYRQAHKEERKEYMKAYRQAHKEEAKEYSQAHKEERKEYNQAHKEEAKEYNKAYHETNRERRLRKYFCMNLEEVENYNLAKADNFVNWDIHHRLETHNSDGERRLVDITHKELMKLGMYYNRPASELIFMKHGEHISLHLKGKKK